jgi:2-polyprenyl-6-methoxyphenol hydroxylase-like FAD-dependent oxidoreductase
VAAVASRPLDIGIIGCGTAGSAAALFFARAGHRVTVYERVASPGPVGAGIVLQPTGLAVLARLGLARAVLARGARIQRLICETPRHFRVVDLPYAVLLPGLHGLGVHRGLLFEQLYGALRRESIELRLGVAMEDLAPAPGGGRYVVSAGGVRHGPHELLVVADGARSRFRDDAVLRKRVATYRWGALWFVGVDPEGRHAGRLHQVVRGCRRMLGLLPTGLGPGVGDGPELVTLFWSIRGDRVEELRRAGLDAWKREVLAVDPNAAPVLDQVRELEEVTFTAYQDVRMERWSTQDVVYLGDAAHAMSPQLGQGANLALWDAQVLAECLATHPGSVSTALDTYSRLRRRHLAFYQLCTRLLTPLFQSDSGLLGLLRDVLMGLSWRLPWMRREMVRTMAGVKLGVLAGGLLPLRELAMSYLPDPTKPP